MLSEGERPASGLRERKKARTRAAIQRHALRLFREQGYEATTASQIAEAAEVSESTFFRYFPTKEDVVLWDDFDPRVMAAFRAQPPELGVVAALRAAIREVLGGVGPDDQVEMRERLDLAMSVPPLRAMLLDHAGGPMSLLAEAVAERSGRRPDDFAVRVVVGAVLGVGLAAMLAAAEAPDADMVALIDRAMGQLEAGLPV